MDTKYTGRFSGLGWHTQLVWSSVLTSVEVNVHHENIITLNNSMFLNLVDRGSSNTSNIHTTFEANPCSGLREEVEKVIKS